MLLPLFPSSLSDGDARECCTFSQGHSQEARLEAASKLIANHAAVLLDVTHPKPMTQTQLVRVPRSSAVYVDQCLREIARRLLGNRPGSKELEEQYNPDMPTQAQAWCGTANYLDYRIQAFDQEMPGRTPDFSPPAAAAFRSVLLEVGMGIATSGTACWLALFNKAAQHTGEFEADGVAGQHAQAAREEAAYRLITNHEAVRRDVTKLL